MYHYLVIGGFLLDMFSLTNGGPGVVVVHLPDVGEGEVLHGIWVQPN